MEEYALNTFSDVWHKDPFRLLDLGNDVQLLYDKVTGNKTGETDRAERNILHAMGEPYKPGEIFFNVTTNVAPVVLDAIFSAAAGARLGKVIRASRFYKPSLLAKSKWGMTNTQALAKAASDVAGKIAKNSMESTGKTLGKAALKGAAVSVIDDPVITSGYGMSRPESATSSKWKTAVLSALSADVEDPARFNEDDVKLAYETIFGVDGLSEALNEGFTPRELISQIRAATKENPDKAAKYRTDFIKAKATHSTKKE